MAGKSEARETYAFIKTNNEHKTRDIIYRTMHAKSFMHCRQAGKNRNGDT
jgi:hypothetical protein